MAKECRHIKTNGCKCEAAALRGQPFCYFHALSRTREQRLASQPALPPPEATLAPIALELPLLEDANAVQVAVSLVVSALAGNRIEPRRAGVLIYALQLASTNLRSTDLKLVSGFSTNVTSFQLAEDG
ncbi:MAG TPA: hypothetical protein VGB94_06910, partial [Acidobacteriaceae bacterium]